MELTNTLQIYPKRAMLSTVARFSIYTLGITLLGAALPSLAQYNDAAVFKENGAVEWLQLGFLVVASTMYFRQAIVSASYRHIFLVLASVSAFAAVREMDANIDAILPWIGWKAGYAFIVLAGVIAYTNKEQVRRQMFQLLNSRAFSLLWAGFIVAIPFAQLVGNGAFLHAIMDEDYSRDYKRIIEEVGELMGYGLLLLGCFELILQNRATVESSDTTTADDR